MIDGLSGLWNRTYFDQTLAAQLSLSKRSGQAMSVVLADMDHFKSINDRFGHLTGDEVLRVIAASMQATCRIEDVVCRFSGAVFGIIVPNTPADRALVMCERLRKSISQLKLSHRGMPVELTCSFGIADVATCDDARSSLPPKRRCARQKPRVAIARKSPVRRQTLSRSLRAADSSRRGANHLLPIR